MTVIKKVLANLIFISDMKSTAFALPCPPCQVPTMGWVFFVFFLLFTFLFLPISEAKAQATGLVVEPYAIDIGEVGDVDLTGYNTYRLYVQFADTADFLVAVYGDADFPTNIIGGNRFWHHFLGGIDNATYVPDLFAIYPEHEYDSFVTVGMTAAANLAAGEQPINLVGDPDADWRFGPGAFFPGSGPGGDINIDTETGGSWFPLFPDVNAFAGPDSLVLIGQFTTDQPFHGQVSVAYAVDGNLNDNALVTFSFDGADAIVDGCTDPAACNFDPSANADDGTCFFPEFCFDCIGNCLCDDDDDNICDLYEVMGCTDEAACNFDPGATEFDESCLYAEPGLDCLGNCLVDTDSDGICDPDEVAGCTDPNACNYDGAATDDDGSCAVPWTCQYCEAGALVTTDEDGDGVCDADEVAGCTDIEADNYAPEATDDDGNCIYSGCTDPAAMNHNAQASINDGSCQYLLTGFPGCTYPSASNFNANATFDDGSCVQGGCTDPEALNHCAASTEDDGSCIYYDDLVEEIIGSNCGADLDGSGFVGSADLILFLSFYEYFCD